jgi:hypothetical protein
MQIPKCPNRHSQKYEEENFRYANGRYSFEKVFVLLYLSHPVLFGQISDFYSTSTSIFTIEK